MVEWSQWTSWEFGERKREVNDWKFGEREEEWN